MREETTSSNWKLNLGMLWLSQLLVMAGFDAMIPFIPLFIEDGLGVTDPGELAFHVSMFNFFGTFAYALFIPVWGCLSDRFGVKPMLLRGTFVTGCLFPIMAYVHDPWMLSFVRFVTAACAGTTAASQAMLARTCPDNRQGFAQGVLTTAIWGGAVLGNVIGGLVIHYYDYKYAIWICGIMYIIAGIAILFTQDNAARKVVSRGSSFLKDFVPMVSRHVYYVIFLFILLGLLRYFEKPFIALRVEEMVGKESASYWTGIVSAIVCVGAILSGAVMGYLSDRLEPQKLLVPMFVLSALFMLLQGVGSSLVLFVVARTLLYIAAGGIQPVLQKILSAITPTKERGSVFGFSSALNSFGGMLASLLAGAAVWASSLKGMFFVGGILYLAFLPAFVIILGGRQKTAEH